MGFALGVLGIIVLVESILIWKLIDRLLVQARIPSLGPIVTVPTDDKPIDTRKKVFSMKISD